MSISLFASMKKRKSKPETALSSNPTCGAVSQAAKHSHAFRQILRPGSRMLTSPFNSAECCSLHLPIIGTVEVSRFAYYRRSSWRSLFDELKSVLPCPGMYSFVGKIRIIILFFGRRRNLPRALLLRFTWIIILYGIFSI